MTRVIRQISTDQAVERPATLEDVRAEVLTPERLNTFVFSALGGIALAHRGRWRRGRPGVLGRRAHA